MVDFFQCTEYKGDVEESVKILLTGSPGCGKTTAVMKILNQLDADRVSGFYTCEMRRQGVRRGFTWNRLDGTSGVLAAVGFKSPFRVSRYGVDVKGFAEHVVEAIDIRRTGNKLLVIDEIGKMECFCERFVQAVREAFASDRSILATVAQKGAGLICEVKSYPDVEVFTLTPACRTDIVDQVLERLSAFKKLSLF